MSGKIENNIITVRQGDSFALKLQISDNNGIVDLSNAELTMQVRNKNDVLMFEAIGVLADGQTDKMLILLTPEQTNIPVDKYKCDIQLILGDGSVHTIFPADVNKIGAFVITEQVTR